MSIGNLKDSGNQGNNMPWQWQVLKGLQAILDEVAEPLTCAEDSVTICGPTGGLDVNVHDGAGTAITSTPIGADTGLDVNIIGGVTLDVTITEANDSILVYGNDGTTNRKIKTDANGELQVDVLTMPATFAEDTAHVSGNTGAFVLGVRNDLNTVMTNADGDYSPIAVNDKGAVAIHDGGNIITVDGTVDLGATTLTALENITVQNPGGASAVNIQDGGNSITVDATALPLPTGAATETTLGDIKTSVQLIDDCVGTDNTAAPAKSFVVAGVTAGGTQQTIEVNASGHVNISDGGGSITVDGTVTANAGTGNFTVVQTTASNLNATVVGGTGVSRTPTILRTSANSSIAAGAYSMSFASVGTANATVGAGLTILKPGETINFDAGAINNTLGAVAYDSSAVGAELLIITLT